MNMEANDYKIYITRMIQELTDSIKHWETAKAEHQEERYSDEFAQYCDGRVDALLVVIRQLKILLEEE
jgi:hypothetical protein